MEEGDDILNRSAYKLSMSKKSAYLLALCCPVAAYVF
jgi:hypothetical protein